MLRFGRQIKYIFKTNKIEVIIIIFGIFLSSLMGIYLFVDTILAVSKNDENLDTRKYMIYFQKNNLNYENLINEIDYLKTFGDFKCALMGFSISSNFNDVYLPENDFFVESVILGEYEIQPLKGNVNLNMNKNRANIVVPANINKKVGELFSLEKICKRLEMIFSDATVISPHNYFIQLGDMQSLDYICKISFKCLASNLIFFVLFYLILKYRMQNKIIKKNKFATVSILFLIAIIIITNLLANIIFNFIIKPYLFKNIIATEKDIIFFQLINFIINIFFILIILLFVEKKYEKRNDH